jgi:uncharacterized protein YjiK
MSIRTQSILIVASVLLVVGFLFYAGLDNFRMDYSEDQYRLADEGYVYSLISPDERHELPGVLREISGLTWLGQQTLACVQDEDGIVFFLNVVSGQIEREVKFAGKGDYEGIAHKGDSIYVLRSDGVIFAFQDNRAHKQKAEKIPTALSRSNNAEGLDFIPFDEGLLIACKDKPGIDKTHNGRALYTMPLHRGQNDSIYLKVLILTEEYNELLQQRGLNSVQHQQFKPSGIARHPFTNHLYVISSTGKILIVLDQSGNLDNAVPLNPKLFRQPEGIAFDDQANLFIASEGKESKGYILKFNRANNL